MSIPPESQKLNCTIFEEALNKHFNIVGLVAGLLLVL